MRGAAIPASDAAAAALVGLSRAAPSVFEFWQDMPFRLHDRTVFTRAAGGEGWVAGKSAP